MEIAGTVAGESQREPANPLGTAFTMQDVARHFGVTERTVHNWMKVRLISYVKFGSARRAMVRFYPEDIHTFAARFRRNARTV